MADVNSYSPAPAKDAKQLKKEKKEQERLQKEKEKQEKKLEKERKKREENERKQREREAKKKQSNQQANGAATTDGKSPTTTGKEASPPQSPPGADAAAETAATTTNGAKQQSPPDCWPEKVKVAEPPGQISGFGEPIAIIFDATQAGKGSMSASCTGTSVGSVPVSISEPWSGICNVHFTPNVADVYTLSVKWGGTDIGGSPFTINLSRLSANGSGSRASLPMQSSVEEKEVEEVKQNGKKEEQEVGEVSDDPFEMAFQASRILEEQRQQATASFSSEGSSGSQPYPSHRQRTSSPQRSGGGPPLQAYPAANQPLPLPMGFPSTKEDVNYLEEINRKLQETNEGLGQEVADLKKKMGEFEEKLSNIEETSRAAEEERKELSANISLRGWLYKRGIKGPTANVWRHRYFRCDQGNKIYYYKSAEDPTPKGYIDLEKVVSVVEVEGEDPPDSEPEKFCFNIVCPERTYQLQTDSDDTRKQWITAIQFLKNWHQKNKSTLMSMALSERN